MPKRSNVNARFPRPNPIDAPDTEATPCAECFADWWSVPAGAVPPRERENLRRYKALQEKAPRSPELGALHEIIATAFDLAEHAEEFIRTARGSALFRLLDEGERLGAHGTSAEALCADLKVLVWALHSVASLTEGVVPTPAAPDAPRPVPVVIELPADSAPNDFGAPFEGCRARVRLGEGGFPFEAFVSFDASE